MDAQLYQWLKVKSDKGLKIWARNRPVQKDLNQTPHRPAEYRGVTGYHQFMIQNCNSEPISELSTAVLPEVLRTMVRHVSLMMPLSS